MFIYFLFALVIILVVYYCFHIYSCNINEYLIFKIVMSLDSDHDKIVHTHAKDYCTIITIYNYNYIIEFRIYLILET